MRFIAEPNLYVRFSLPLQRALNGKKGFYFDSNGKFETEIPVLVKALSRQFEIDNPDEIENKVESTETIRRCKKCDFTCGKQGDLLAHYRKNHPKKEAK